MSDVREVLRVFVMAKYAVLLTGILLSVLQTASATVVEISSEPLPPTVEDTFSLSFSVPEQSVEAANSLKAFDSEVNYDPVHLVLTGYDFSNSIDEYRLDPAEDDHVGNPRDSLWQEVVSDTIGFSRNSDFLPSLKHSNEFVFLSLEFATFRATTDIGVFLDIFDPFMYFRNAWGNIAYHGVESSTHRFSIELDSNTNLPEPENLSLLLLAIALFLFRARYISLQ